MGDRLWAGKPSRYACITAIFVVWGWVGLGMGWVGRGSTTSPHTGLGWVSYLVGWIGSGSWVNEMDPRTTLNKGWANK